MVEDSWGVEFSSVTVEGRIVDSNMDGFSSNLLAVSVCFCKVGDVGLGMVVGNVVFVNCTGDMTIVFFYYIPPNICWTCLCKKGHNFLLGKTICRLFFVLVVMTSYLKGA